MLEDVPAGTNVAARDSDSGKWQRKTVIPQVLALPRQSTLTDPDLTRLPRTASEGHIPRIGLSTGHSDALECLLRKIGIADAASSRPTPRRVE